MQIDPTKRTPAVIIEPSFIEIKGECFPEDVAVFAQPIMEELKKFLTFSEGMNVNIELHYFNSSSGKFLFDFILEFKFPADIADYADNILVLHFCEIRDIYGIIYFMRNLNL